ncbi:MAG: amidohydrolase family protein [Acidobacteria bacterium]|nr:amidohydrolase family protein [Acidobacteriota bacterium]
MRIHARSHGRISVWFGVFWLAAGFVPAQDVAKLPPEVIAYADMVLHNGKILTADRKFTIVEAAAIRDGKFLAVGNNDRILTMAGPQTRRVDLRGRSVVPGFIDTHLHSAFIGNNGMGALETGPRERPDWTKLESVLAWVKAEVAKAKPGEIVALSGPSNKLFIEQLNAKVLDDIAPNTPVFIEATNDQLVANSLVLKMVPPNTPGILKDKDGNPTGQLRGAAAGVCVWDLEPWPAVELLLEPQKKAFLTYNQQGLTTIGGRTKGLAISVFRELMMRNELTVRARAIHELMRQNGQPEAYLKRVGNLTDFGNDMFKIIGTTVQVVDGTTGSGSARTSFTKISPPSGDPYSPFGQNKWEDTEDLANSDRKNILLANRYGWTILGLHSSGDMSTAILLDVFEEAHKERPLTGRHFGIDHGEMIRPEDYKRFKDLDVVPSLYSKAMYGNDDLIQMYGMDRVSTFQPVRSLIDAGVEPAAEADARPPYSAPLFNIQRWVTRLDEKGRVINAKEKVSRQEALYMYTLWAARYSGEQDLIGSIEPGKLADLVVLNGDYMTFPEAELHNLRILMTVVGGKTVHEVPGAF